MQVKMIRDDSGERDGWWIGQRFYHLPRVGEVWERGGAFYRVWRISKSGRTLEVRRCQRDGSCPSPYSLDMRMQTLLEQFAVPPTTPSQFNVKEK